MRYYKKLYVGESLDGREEEIIDKLDEGEFLLNTYVITLARGRQNHLEFFDSVLLRQEIIAGPDLLVVGIAGGYEEALVVVEEITREVYDKTKGADIRSFILNREREL